MKASEIKIKEILGLMRKHSGLITAKEMATVLARIHPPEHPSKNQDLINELEPEVLRKFKIFFGVGWVRSEHIEEGPHETLVQAFEITNRGIQAIAEM